MAFLFVSRVYCVKMERVWHWFRKVTKVTIGICNLGGEDDLIDSRGNLAYDGIYGLMNALSVKFGGKDWKPISGPDMISGRWVNHFQVKNESEIANVFLSAGYPIQFLGQPVVKP